MDRMFQKLAIALMLAIIGFSTSKAQVTKDTMGNTMLPVWKEGYLDIHHINTSKGNATFMVFPDGTTMLVDAGDMDVQDFNRQYAPMKANTTHLEDTTFSAGKYIADYINKAMPSGHEPSIDYALITHFHQDHYGKVNNKTKMAPSGGYKLTGITEVGTWLKIRNLLDRGYPAYNFPTDLRTYYKDRTFHNYLAFIDYQVTQGMHVQSLLPGSNTQIKLLYRPSKFPSFYVRNIKANGTLWSGDGEHTIQAIDAQSFFNDKNKFDENPLSLAMKITYGDFDYYTGGDNTGITDAVYDRHDMETSIANATGRVDVMTLDHHGNWDATNDYFLQKLDPQVVVSQAWCSDHIGQDIAFRLLKERPGRTRPDVFATYLHEEAKVYLGPRVTKGFKSMEGHTLIRVMPGGETFYVMVLEDNPSTFTIKKQFGAYHSR